MLSTAGRSIGRYTANNPHCGTAWATTAARCSSSLASFWGGPSVDTVAAAATTTTSPSGINVENIAHVATGEWSRRCNNVKQLTKMPFNPFHNSPISTTTTPTTTTTTTNRVNFVQGPHPSAPVFVGFAVAPNSLAKFSPLGEDSDYNNIESWMDPIEESIVAMQDDDNINCYAQEGLELMNRNARSSKNKANKGKRPCNRQARRAKKIKLGRRRRS